MAGVKTRSLVYVAVSSQSVPPNLAWKAGPGRLTKVEYCIGRTYKRVRDPKTERYTYYKLAEPEPTQLTAEQIDAEPVKGPQVRYRKGQHCWFVDTDARWYLCIVVDRKPAPKDRITIRPVAGLDSEHLKPWPYGSELEFPAGRDNPLFQRLRPLKAKRV